jgi:hypothetical protein
MENYSSAKSESFVEINGEIYEVYKIPINSKIYKLYYKDCYIYYPNNYPNEKKKEYEKKDSKNNYS